MRGKPVGCGSKSVLLQNLSIAMGPGTASMMLRDNNSVRIRNFAPAFFLSVLCLAEGTTWQTATELPGVDWHGISGARKQAALKFIREESCTCGCSMKIAECRMKDPGCSYSRK